MPLSLSPVRAGRPVLAAVLACVSLLLTASSVLVVHAGPASAAAGPTTQARVPWSATSMMRANGARFRGTPLVTAPPVVRMRAWAVADMDTGEVLAVRAFRKRLPMASTIKLLTAVTAVERVPARPAHQVSWDEAHPQYCTCAGLVVGSRYTRKALLAGMLLPSGNDAAEALAGSDPAGRAAFISAMNTKAAALGATDTRAANASGLTAAGSYSSARDLLVLLRAAQATPAVERVLGKAQFAFGPMDGPRHMLRRATDYVNRYPGAQGKSGYTTPALNTLVVSTVMPTSSGTLRRIGVATLGAPGGFSTTGTRALTEWAAANYDDLARVGRLPAAPGPVVGDQAATMASLTTPAG